MEDLVNSLTWEMFMSVTLSAAVHLGKGLLGEFTFYQKSATTISKTIVRCDTEVDHRSEEVQGISMIDWPFLAKDNFVN